MRPSNPAEASAGPRPGNTPENPANRIAPGHARDRFAEEGFVWLEPSPASLDWAGAAWDAAAPRVADPAWRSQWLRCDGTWFTGVDLLPNAPDGSVGGQPLPVPDLVGELGLTHAAWHAGQVSVTYPGYPRPKEGESPGAARYRMTRDAAHVDGLLPEGTPARRFLREPHAFILGIALTDSAPDASPLVVWPGSHRTMGAAFRTARAPHPGPAGTLDLTEEYAAARRAVFASHTRTVVPLRRGAMILLHRHLLHGIAPWRAGADDAGRAIAYFRPQLEDLERWF